MPPQEEAGNLGSWNVVLLGSCATTYPSTAVAASFPYAYVTSFLWEGDPRGALDVINFGTSRVPQIVGSYDCPQIGCLRLPIDVHYKDGFAYVADLAANQEFGSHTYKFDVSTPSNPHIECLYGSPGNARGVWVEESNVYEASFSAGLQVNSTACYEQGRTYTSHDATGVAVRGRYAYVSDNRTLYSFGQLTVVDVLDPENPVVAGHCRTAGPGAHDAALPMLANPTPETPPCAYVADGTGLSVFDVTVPSAPGRLGRIAMSGLTRWVHVSGRLGVVAAGDVGFYVLSFANPANPVIVGSYDTSGYCWAACMIGTTICVADGEAGFGLYRYVGL